MIDTHIMRHFLTPDLVGDHPIGLLFAVLAIIGGELLMIDPWLAIGAGVLFGLNVLTTLIFTYYRKNQINGELVKATFIRAFGYVMVTLGVVVFSNMGSGDAGFFLREVVFRGIAGIELFVLAGMTARMVPRFRPVYKFLVEKGDAMLPFDFGSGDVSEVLDAYAEGEKEQS